MDSQSVSLLQHLGFIFAFAALPAYLGARKGYSDPRATKESVFLSTLTATGVTMLVACSVVGLTKFVGTIDPSRFDQMNPITFLVLGGLFIVGCIIVVILSAIPAFTAATAATLSFPTGRGATSLLAGVGAALGASILFFI